MGDSVLASLANLSEKLPAVEDRSGIWTRADLRRGVQYAHAYFSRNGIGPGDRVAILTGDDKRVVAALLGARAMGALVCPVDPADAEEQVARIRPRLVVAAGRVPGLDAIDVGALFAEPGPSLPVAPGRSASAWGVSTSGSSGPPKTVVLTESSVAHVTAAIQECVRYTARDRVHGGLPLHHTYGLSQLWLAMASGACLYLPGGQPTQAHLPRWLGGATVLPTIPPRLRLLFELGARPDARLITLAGQSADPDTRKLFASAQSSANYMYFYGLTEASTRVLWLGHEEFFQRPRATGRPIRGVRAWIEPDGELWVEGPNVAAGYLDDPAATAARFPGGTLRTGDHFEVDGDLFSYLGRIDGIFKRFGEKVIPEQVEAALQSHPDVLKCLVTPEPGPGGEPVPVAWVVGRPGSADGPALLRHARALVPPVMVPVVVRFVPSLPTTSNGKLVRVPPEVSPRKRADAPIAAKPGRAEIEAWLRDALGSMLAVAPSSIEATRPLFEYGLDSFGSIDLIAALEQWLGRSVSYSVIWSHPTLAALSEHLAGAAASGARQPNEEVLDARRWSAPVSRSHEAVVPVSQLERRRLQLSRAAPDCDGRSVWLAGEAAGAFRPDIFTTTLGEFVMRHDVLRSKFSCSGGRDSKVILPRLPIDVGTHDLTGLPERDRRQRGLSILAQEVRQVFDLDSAPLLKAAVVQLAERRYFFLVVFDHVISDAASVGLAWSDLRGIYAALASGRDPPPRPDLQYIDFTDWHECLLASPHAERLKEHWARHLAGSVPPTRRAAHEGPGAEEIGERSDAARAPFPCHCALLDIPDAVTAGARRTAMRHGCTSFVFYYSAFAVLLARVSGDSDISISSSYDFRNRERELRNVFGMLTNTCALRIDLTGVATLSDLLGRARKEVSRMIASSDLPATLYPATGVFQVLFNYVEVGTQTIESAWDGCNVRALGRASLPIAGYPYRNTQDLLLVLRHNAGRLSGAIIANAELWSKPAVREMASEYGELLRRMAEPGADPAELRSRPLLDR